MTIIHISKINNNPPGPDRANLNEEYVELANNSNKDVDLLEWTIEDVFNITVRQHVFKFEKFRNGKPRTTKIKANSTLKIRTGHGDDNDYNAHWEKDAAVWNNTGDEAVLRDNSGSEVSRKSVDLVKLPALPGQITKIKVSGQVSDAVCWQGVKAHLVFESLKGQETVETDSDENGNYKTELTTGRDYTVTVSATNYDDFPDTINTKAGKDITKNFKLTPNLEIELGVDSTDVKFTRKDDSLINAIKQLTNKITVDINTNYTFTVKVAINKGMTKSIIAALKEGKKSIETLNDGFCRIDESNKQLIFSFSPLKYNKTDWHKEDWFGSHTNWTEKTLNYSVGLNGSYGNNQFGPKDFPLGKIVIKVTNDKLNAQTAYNILHFAALASLVAAIIAIVLLVPPVGAAIATAFGIELSASALSLAFGSFSLASSVLWFAMQFLVTQMNDPPELDKNYKKLVRVKLLKPKKMLPLAASIENFVTLKDAIVTSRDRLYSAHIYRDSAGRKKQTKNVTHLLKLSATNTRNILKSIKQMQKIAKPLKLSANLVSKVRNLIRTKKIPLLKIKAKLKKQRFTSEQIKSMFKAINSKKFKNTSLTFPLISKGLMLAVSQFERTFFKEIKKEMQWYKKA